MQTISNTPSAKVRRYSNHLIALSFPVKDDAVLPEGLAVALDSNGELVPHVEGTTVFFGVVQKASKASDPNATVLTVGLADATGVASAAAGVTAGEYVECAGLNADGVHGNWQAVTAAQAANGIALETAAQNATFRVLIIPPAQQPA